MTTDRTAAAITHATLFDGRPGLRGLLNVVAAALSDPNAAVMPVLRFVPSDNTLERYGEVMEEKGLNLET